MLRPGAAPGYCVGLFTPASMAVRSTQFGAGEVVVLEDRHKACKAFQNRILFHMTVRSSGASVLATRCTTDTSIETVLYNPRRAEHVRGH